MPLEPSEPFASGTRNPREESAPALLASEISAPEISAPAADLARRKFMWATGGLLGSLALAGKRARAAEPDPSPRAPSPRATSGDRVEEPNWKERLTITVGPNNADLTGSSDRVLQAGVDYVARLGGGTVRVLPGEYELRNAVYLATNTRILGSGADSILKKAPSNKVALAADSDWFDQEITLEDAADFRVGDGVCLRTKNPHNGGVDIVKRTLVARDGRRFKLDRALRQNFWLMGETTCSSLFPLLSGEEIENVVIENITLDGNRAQNENLDGNYAGCVFLQDCHSISIREVTARDYNGDGISWQICHDVVVENCRSFGHAGLGLHPGSGSQRPVIRGNRLEGNDIGLFFCWGVKRGLAEKNVILGNRLGVSIGHRDTDNLIRENEIARSGQAGVLFRPERGKDFAPHRNRLENNRIVDSGPDDGVGIDVQGEVESILISRNEIRETREPMSRVGVRVGKGTRDIELVANTIEGFSKDVLREGR